MLVRMTMKDTTCRVKLQGVMSEEFRVKTGILQEDTKASTLFNMTLEKAVRAIRTNMGGTIFNQLTQHLAYADDVEIVARSLSALAGALEEFETASAERGLRINAKKTVYKKSSRHYPLQNKGEISISTHKFPVCSEFKYHGSLVMHNNNVKAEIGARIAAGNRCYFTLQRVLGFQVMSRKAREVVYKTMIRPVVTYGGETWTMTAKKTAENLGEENLAKNI